MSMTNDMSRRSYSIAASGHTQENFNTAAQQLESLIDQRDGDVSQAMADYEAEGVSESYRAKEVHWHNVADQVRHIILTLRTALNQNDDAARQGMHQAQGYVDNI